MQSYSQRGASTGMVVSLVLCVLLLIGAGAFGAWAYAGRQDYKQNVDQKVTAAVEIAVKETETKKDNEFIEREKEPFRVYTGPAAFGTISITYPKTWSVLANESGKGAVPLDIYMHPRVLPGLDSGASFAVRVQVAESTYDTQMRQFEALTKSGKTRVSAYALPKILSIVGARVDGEIVPKKQGSMVLIPMRDKTLKIWTEANEFMGDFNNIILANINFVP